MLDDERLNEERSPGFVVGYFRFDFGCPELPSEPRGAAAPERGSGCRGAEGGDARLGFPFT